MRPRSLFWTFAGAFLLVVIAAAVLQVVVSVAVLRPLANQHARERAEQTIDRVSRELVALADSATVPDVIDVLRANMTRERGELLVFSARNGRVLHDRRVPPEVHRGIVERLDAEGLASVTADQRAGPPLGGPGLGPPGFGGPGGEGPPFPDGEGPALGRRDGPPFPNGEGPPFANDAGTPPRRGEGPPPPERPFQDARGAGPASERFDLLAHQAVVRDGRVLGELAVVGPPSGAGLWSLPESRGLLLILPFAVIVSGGAGLFLVRLLVRRLNALERVTDRLAAGDVAVPADDRGLDEIGRLEHRFGRMADHVVAARARLEETDRQRRRLLADVSHELATPLTSIRGYVETLLDPNVTTTAEEREQYLEDVLAEAKRLEAMTGELFDLARLEAGATPLQRVRLDWTALCRNTARRFEPRFREAGLSLEWNGSSDAAWVHADGRRLEEVAENLLSNALRYVPTGGRVALSLMRAATPAGERLRLTVEDDGPGIADEDLPHVFERFYRAEGARSKEGTGLGLAIVAEIVRLHGGEVSARRHTPRGAAFVVDLPPGDGAHPNSAGARS